MFYFKGTNFNSGYNSILVTFTIQLVLNFFFVALYACEGRIGWVEKKQEQNIVKNLSFPHKSLLLRVDHKMFFSRVTVTCMSEIALQDREL